MHRHYLHQGRDKVLGEHGRVLLSSERHGKTATTLPPQSCGFQRLIGMTRGGCGRLRVTWAHNSRCHVSTTQHQSFGLDSVRAKYLEEDKETAARWDMHSTTEGTPHGVQGLSQQILPRGVCHE